MSSKDDRRIEAWLNDDYGRFAEALRKFAAKWHNARFRWLGATHTFAKLGMASSAPAVTWYAGILSGLNAALISVVLFTGHSVVAALDTSSKEKSPKELQADMMLRLGDFLNYTKTKALAKKSDAAITACLGIIQNFDCLITGSKQDAISVSLVLFVGNHKTRMVIKHRNPGNKRPTGQEFDASKLMGYKACTKGKEPRVVHHFKKFGKEAADSPTQSGKNYQSFFIMPIESKVDGRIRGFVSIDSPRPYAFYENRSSVLIVRCEPLMSHLCDLLERV